MEEVAVTRRALSPASPLPSRKRRKTTRVASVGLGVQESCQSNKENLSKVKFHHKTCSRPYISHVHALKEARKGAELTAIDLFKECHNGKKAGFSKPADMESAMELELRESGEQKSVAAVVAGILTKECPSSKFLQNVGLESTSKKKLN
ncbi:hypothetical protein D1007_41859 [Hordeum vulgare]|nr:hypothetical protein D1007_41859 [Hordeum vulgare]